MMCDFASRSTTKTKVADAKIANQKSKSYSLSFRERDSFPQREAFFNHLHPCPENHSSNYNLKGALGKRTESQTLHTQPERHKRGAWKTHSNEG